MVASIINCKYADDPDVVINENEDLMHKIAEKNSIK